MIYPVQTFGQVGTNLERAAVRDLLIAGRDPIIAGRDLLTTCSVQLCDGSEAHLQRAGQAPRGQNVGLITCFFCNLSAQKQSLFLISCPREGQETDRTEDQHHPTPSNRFITCNSQDLITCLQDRDGNEVHLRRVGPAPLPAS